MSAQSYDTSGGSTSRAVASSALSACVDEKPGAGTPVSSAARNRLKRLVNSGPALDPVDRSVSSGTMLPFWFRTKNNPSCFGSWRNSGSACRYTL